MSVHVAGQGVQIHKAPPTCHKLSDVQRQLTAQLTVTASYLVCAADRAANTRAAADEAAGRKQAHDPPWGVWRQCWLGCADLLDHIIR